MFKISTSSATRSLRLQATQKLRSYATPSNPKSPSMGGYYAIGAITVIGGATLCYAKFDGNFRKYLKSNLPITDDVIKFVFQEEKTFQERYQKIETKLDNLKSTLSLNESVAPKTTPTATKITTTAPSKVLEKETSKVVTSAPMPDPIMDPVESNLTENEKPVVQKKQEPPSNIDKSMIDLSESAIKSYNVAVTSLRDFTHQIDQLIDQNFEKIDAKVWHQLKSLSQQKDDAIQQAEQTFQQVTQHIKNYDLKTKINEARQEFIDELQKTDITNRFWQQIDQARKQYENELSILCPSIKLNEANLKLSAGELDLFILHAQRKIEFLQRELIKMEIKRERELRDALDKVRKDGLIDPLVEENIKLELDKEKRKLVEEYQRKGLQVEADAEREIVAQLKRATEAHSDHLADAIKNKESQLQRTFTKQLNEEITKAKMEYKTQLATMVGKLKGVDSALKVRADADRNAHQAQALWSACQALHQAIKSDDFGDKNINLQPLSNQITAIKTAASDNDELVDAVIKSIPDVALNRGVFNESSLRERFPKVCQVARRLAFVPEEGARLPVYLLSFVQSLLLIDSTTPITKEELNDNVVDFTQLTTNDILQRARYWVDRGDFSQTLRYMNLLTGASRVVAEQWMKEVQILLETKQAANTLMAHAAANGLVYL